MKMTINKSVAKKQQGEYSSIDELVKTKLKRASHRLQNIDLSKLPKPA